MLFIFAFIISLVPTMILIPPIMKWADIIGAIDIPDARKVHKHAIPRVGGIAMVAGTIISIAILAEFDQQLITILVGFAVIWGFGLWDDKCDLNYKIKFLGQLLAVIIVVTWGDVIVRNVPFLDMDMPDYLAIPFTIFALVGITNAINLSDGLDGLAGGTSLISISMIALLAYDAGGDLVVLICMAVAGSILGFLRHNTYPARLFMGDTGSQFLGFSLGILVIILSQTVNPAMSPVVALFILGLPILDTFAVMSQRIYEKRSPFSPDKNHIHHKLLELGFDHYEAVFIIYLMQSSMLVLAYFLLYESDSLLAIIYLLVAFIVLGSFQLARVSTWRFHEKPEAKNSALSSFVEILRTRGLLTKVPIRVLGISLILIFFSGVIFAEQISLDMLILAAVLLAMLAISSVVKHERGVFIEKIVVYVVSVMAVYMLGGIGRESDINYIINFIFALLLIAFVLRIRFSKDKSFQVTPLDYLVIILIIVVPNLPEVHLEDSNIGEMAIKLVILFYASEAILGASRRNWGLVKVGVTLALILAIVLGL